jgi:uncharacterized metal-binding protein YceD (DUF177 family)
MPPDRALIRLNDPAGRTAREVRLEPAPEQLAALAADLGLLGVRKVRLEGRLTPEGRRDWRLDARLGATVVQPCVVTLAPVTTRLDEPVTRRYVEAYVEPKADEMEMPEDDTAEPLPDTLDLAALLAEALALGLPLYPRAPDAELGDTRAAPPGVEPLTDEATRPFAALKALREPPDGGDS